MPILIANRHHLFDLGSQQIGNRTAGSAKGLLISNESTDQRQCDRRDRAKQLAWTIEAGLFGCSLQTDRRGGCPDSKSAQASRRRLTLQRGQQFAWGLKAILR